VYSIPTLFDGWEPAQGDGLPRHVQPVARVATTAKSEGCDRFIYLSSTSVYGDHDGEWVDEDSERRPTSPVGKMRRDIEDYVLGLDDWNANVVRIVGIYGPGRTLDRYVAGGRYKLVDGGHKLSNRIHVDDLAGIVLAVAGRAPTGARAYLAADGHPVRVVDLVDWMVEHLGIERPAEVTLDEYRAERGENAAARWQNTYRARNERVTRELSYALRYPTVIDGYEAIFDV
jgi:nucleoside-diphosphate-sugar epimerase